MITESALTGAFVAMAWGLVKAIEAMTRRGNGGGVNKTLTRIDSRTTDLWESHKPVDGRYQWYFPHDFGEKQDKMIENQGEMLTELRTISGHLKTISNGGGRAA